MHNPFTMKTTIAIAFFLGCTFALLAQPVPLTLAEAFDVAARNYPLLERERLSIAQQEARLGLRSPLSRTDIFLAGAQVDPSNPAIGIHGAGFIQRFNWPGSARYREPALREQLLSGNARLQLTAFELKNLVAEAYLQLVYAQHLRKHYQEVQNLMSELVSFAELRFELGETGKIPVLSAQGKQKLASLGQQQAQQAFEVAYTVFNNLMYSDTVYQSVATELPGLTPEGPWFVNAGHPRLLAEQQDIRVAEAEALYVQSQFLPQVIAGAQLQVINESLPFLAYQIGLSVPLSRKPLKAQVEVARREVDIQQAEYDAAQRELENERREGIARVNQARAKVRFLLEELLPLAADQIESSRKAYTQGAVGYQDYLVNLEQAIESRRQYIDALYEYHAARVCLELLSGRR